MHSELTSKSSVRPGKEDGSHAWADWAVKAGECPVVDAGGKSVCLYTSFAPHCQQSWSGFSAGCQWSSRD